MIDKYLQYISSVRRYSPRTLEIYRSVLESFVAFAQTPDQVGGDVMPGIDRASAGEALTPQMIRSYEVALMEKGESPRTVHLHLSVLSGFCRFLMKEGVLKSNPVKLVTRPKTDKHLPEVYREAAIQGYLSDTQFLIDEYEAFADAAYYKRRLGRMVIHLLYATGIRRAELIGLRIADFDPARQMLRVRGKGDKIREIPLISSLCKEILLYLQSVETMAGGERPRQDPLLVTEKFAPLYPVRVDRIVKEELSGVKGITGRRSPHVLRHTLATELLDDGAPLSAIKEMLGHSSLAATQVYTHTSIARLRQVYHSAHPRAKKEGKDYGD